MQVHGMFLHKIIIRPCSRDNYPHFDDLQRLKSGDFGFMLGVGTPCDRARKVVLGWGFCGGF